MQITLQLHRKDRNGIRTIDNFFSPLWKNVKPNASKWYLYHHEKYCKELVEVTNTFKWFSDSTTRVQIVVLILDLIKRRRK
eukprot:c445_g1_i1 orf=208-450(-)